MTRASISDQPHIAFLLPDLGGGGAERLTVDLMAGFVARGFAVDLLLQRCEGTFLPLVPAGVRVIDLAASRLRRVFAPLRAYLKTEQPDVLVAAMWPLTSIAIASAVGLPTRVVVSEHCALGEQYSTSRVTLATMRASIRASYRFADRIVAVSRGLADEIADLAGLPAARVLTIYNPIPKPLRSDAGRLNWGSASGKRVLAIGKLKGQKNFSLLIDAFEPLAKEGIATLAIVGEGEQRTTLELQIARLGLQGRVILPGFTNTPGDWYADADLFVMSSDYEGFGNVIVEAMHCGLPVVATDCRHGPAEILGNGRWGTLVPTGDAAKLAAAMRNALATAIDADAQRARAAQFSIERAVAAYAGAAKQET